MKLESVIASRTNRLIKKYFPVEFLWRMVLWRTMCHQANLSSKLRITQWQIYIYINLY